MSTPGHLTRMNSVGEDEDDIILIDGAECPEYETDGGYWKCITNQNISLGNVCSKPQHCVPESVSNKGYTDISVNNFGTRIPFFGTSPIRPSSSGITCFPFIKSRDYSGEHRRKIQRQSSTEVFKLSRTFETLEIDHNHIDEVLKQDEDGDNLIAIALILCNTNLAVMLTNIVPCHSLLNTINNVYQTTLHLAALTNNETMVRRLLVAGADVTVKDRNGNTALHIACSKGFIGVARVLLEPVRYLETKENSYQIPYQKIPQNLELRNAQGLTCLLISAYRTDKAMLELLISKYADINAFDIKNGKTCLHIFSESGNLDMVKALVSKPGLDLNRRTFSSFTAVEMAFYRGHGDIVSYLLYNGCEPEIRCITSGEFDAESSDSDLTDED